MRSLTSKQEKIKVQNINSIKSDKPIKPIKQRQQLITSFISTYKSARIPRYFYLDCEQNYKAYFSDDLPTNIRFHMEVGGASLLPLTDLVSNRNFEDKSERDIKDNKNTNDITDSYSDDDNNN